MKPVASVIDLHAGKFEASGIPSNVIALFENSHFGLSPLYELPCSSDTGRTRPKYYNSGFRHIKK
jgi:hypothetical protein